MRIRASLYTGLVLTFLLACQQATMLMPVPVEPVMPTHSSTPVPPAASAATAAPMATPTMIPTEVPPSLAEALRSVPPGMVVHDAQGNYVEIGGEKFRPVFHRDRSGNRVFLWTTTHIKNGSLLEGTAAPLLVTDPTGQVRDMAPITIEYQYGVEGPYVEFINEGVMWGRPTLPNIIWSNLQVRFYGSDHAAVPARAIEFFDAVTSPEGLTLEVITEDGSHPWRISRSTGYIVRVVNAATAKSSGFGRIRLPFDGREIFLQAEIDPAGNLVQYVAPVEPLEGFSSRQYLQMIFFSLARAAKFGDLTETSWDEAQMQAVNIYSMLGNEGTFPYIKVTDKKR